MKKDEVEVIIENKITLDEDFKIKLCLSNKLGFAKDIVAYFNKNGEEPGKEGKSIFEYSADDSTNEYSVFYSKIRFEKIGYKTFYIELNLNDEAKCIKYNSKDEKAIIASKDEYDYWEIFVYYSSFKTPEWIKGGIMYQIYVDTFCSKDLPKKLKNKVVKWNAEPKWRPDEDGKYRNDQFYGGNLKGIISKLPYIKSLNVNVIYLTPIFKSPSSNRYDISDYEMIDEMVGTWKDLDNLHKKANKMGMKIVIDCVFNHSSNENQLFIDKPDIYDWKEKYVEPKCWWDYKHLIEFNKFNTEYLDYLSGWLKKYEKYVDGIRLDVADCLPDYTLKHIRKNFGKYILGEVWKNAITGDYREFLVGDELDGIMNYQFANAIYRYVRWGNWNNFLQIIEKICKLYPNESLEVSPIFLSSHDIPRIPNILVGDFMKESSNYENVWDMEQDDYWITNDKFDTVKFRTWEMENCQVPDEKLELSNKLMKIAVFLQFTLPGLPSIFAGDEAGVTGFKDPTNRKTFPWDNIDNEKLGFYKEIGEFRKKYKKNFSKSKFRILEIDENKIIYKRDKLIFVVNRSDKDIFIDKLFKKNVVYRTEKNTVKNNGRIPKYSAVVFAND